MEVRLAALDDVETVLDLLAEASAWLRGRGIEQWPERFPFDQVGDPIARNETWLALMDGETVGTFTLTDVDNLVWPGATGSALYLHRFAVRRSHAGHGRSLLCWAEDAATSKHRDFLRLDCWNRNRALRDYYEAAGFEHCGDRGEFTWTLSNGDTRPGWAVSRYQKDLRREK